MNAALLSSKKMDYCTPVSYAHLRAHETMSNRVFGVWV